MLPDNFFEETPFFSDEHHRLAAGVRKFVEQEIEPRAGAPDGDADAGFHEMLGLLAQAGLLRHAVRRTPSSFEWRSLCLIREALAYSSPLADLAFVTQGVGTYAIALAAPEHVRDFWLQRAVEGKAVAAFALTEPEAGSDAGALQTTARREADAYIIDGRKRFVTNAGVADFYTVFARTGTRSDGRALVSAFIVGAKMAGFRLLERTQLMGSHPLGEIEFAQVRVPAENLIGGEGEGFNLAMKTLDAYRASVGAAACGMAKRALDEALDYARRRQQFGVAISQFQLMQAKLADMSTELDAARLLVYQAAYQRDVHGDARDARSARRSCSPRKRRAASLTAPCRSTALTA
ncbi:MAG: acyl-CoA dehydrogenase family protein [Pyrinomonadaceae bacterium]